MRDHFKQLFESTVPDQVLAKSVRVPDKITQGTRSICTCFFLLIFEQINKELDTRSQMFIQNLVVESGIADSEACKLAGVPVRILATLNRGLYQPVLEQLLVEVACMSAKVTYQVTDLGANAGIFVTDEGVEVDVDIGSVDWLVELFGDAGKL